MDFGPIPSSLIKWILCEEEWILGGVGQMLALLYEKSLSSGPSLQKIIKINLAFEFDSWGNFMIT